MRAVQWWVSNGAMAGVLYHAVLGAQWAANIVIFMTWLVLVISLLCLGNDDAHAAMRAKGRSVPAALSYAYDIGFTLVLAGLGWFWTASAWVVASLAQYAIYDTKPKGAPGGPS